MESPEHKTANITPPNSKRIPLEIIGGIPLPVCLRGLLCGCVLFLIVVAGSTKTRENLQNSTRM